MIGAARRADLAALGQALAHSPEDRLGRVLAMLDSLPNRGEADRVLDPARARLRRLRPRRRPNLTRLIFLPLDGAIVPPNEWRPGAGGMHQGTLPRTALQPLSTLVCEAQPGLTAEVSAACAVLAEQDEAGLLALGGRVWGPAATALAAASRGAAPPGWTAAGLPAAAFAPLALLCALLIAQGSAIQRAVIAGAEGPPEEPLRAALAPLAQGGAAAVSAGVSTLLRTASDPGRVAALAAQLCPALTPHLDDEMEEHLLSRLPDEEAVLPEMAAQTAALARMIEDVGRVTAARGPPYKARLERLRQQAQQSCRTRHEEAARETVLARVEAVAAEGVDDEAMAMLEEEALALRGLETAALRLGYDPAYDRTRRRVLERLEALARGASRARRMDLARIAEMLGDADGASKLLG